MHPERLVGQMVTLAVASAFRVCVLLRLEETSFAGQHVRLAKMRSLP